MIEMRQTKWSHQTFIVGQMNMALCLFGEYEWNKDRVIFIIDYYIFELL